MKRIILLILILTVAAIAQNYSLVFNGTDDYVQFSSSPAYTETITIEAWIKTTSTEALNDFISWGNTSDGSNVQFRITSGVLEFGTHPNGGSWISTVGSQSIITGEWVHVAVVKNGESVQLYVNGIADGSGTNSNVTSVDFMCIGKYTKEDIYFPGNIDEVRIWNDVRTEAEIRQNMYRELPAPASETNLVAYYQFNETSGTTLSDYNGNYDGALTNMAGTEWQTSSAMYGPKNCLDFDGTNDFIEATITSSSSSTVTLEYMIMFNSLTNQQNMVYLAQAQSANCRIVPYKDSANEINLFISDASANQVVVNSGYTVSANVWYHLCFVYDNRETKIYINGKLEASETITSNFSLDGSDYLCLGSDNGNTSFICSVKFDQVRIWNTARSALEIRENMCKSLTGNETGLITYYTFDNISGTILPDYTGNGNNGTLTNMDGSTDWEASSAFNTWLNTPSTNWSTAENWSNGIPVVGDNVGIYDYGNGYSEPDIPASQSFHNLYLGSNTSSSLTSAMTVNGSLILERNLDLAGNTITLGALGELIEDAGYLYGSSGTITTTRSLSNIDMDVAGLGAVITEDGDLGSTTITRGHTAQGTSGIERYYQITSNNAPTNATLVFNYLDTELNGTTEADLDLYKSADGNSWTEQSATLNTSANTLTLSGINSFSYWTAGDTGFGANIHVQVKVFLEGPYNADNDAMATTLNTNDIIPTTAPYAQDARTISSIPADIVDWVLVQIRSTADGSTVASKSALLHKDGRIVGDDGTTSFIEMEADAGDYFIVIKHRNHLAIESDEVHTLSTSGNTLYDFTVNGSTAFDKYYGGDAAVVETGVYGMYAGNPNGDGLITNADKDPVNTNMDASNYQNGDINMDGLVTNADKDFINTNMDKASSVNN